jgi:hypothetical protein
MVQHPRKLSPSYSPPWGDTYLSQLSIGGTAWHLMCATFPANRIPLDRLKSTINFHIILNCTKKTLCRVEKMMFRSHRIPAERLCPSVRLSVSSYETTRIFVKLYIGKVTKIWKNRDFGLSTNSKNIILSRVIHHRQNYLNWNLSTYSSFDYNRDFKLQPVCIPARRNDWLGEARATSVTTVSSVAMVTWEIDSFTNTWRLWRHSGECATIVALCIHFLTCLSVLRLAVHSQMDCDRQCQQACHRNRSRVALAFLWRCWGKFRKYQQKIGVFSPRSVSSQFSHFIRLLDTVNGIKQLKKCVSAVLTTVVKLNYKDCSWDTKQTAASSQRASGFL